MKRNIHYAAAMVAALAGLGWMVSGSTFPTRIDMADRQEQLADLSSETDSAQFCRIPLDGQIQDPYLKSMETALRLFDEARVVADQEAVLDSLDGITERYPDQWLAYYWTAHIYGQTGRLYPEDNPKFRQYMEQARQKLERAWAVHSDPGDLDRAELHILEALISRLTSFTYYDPRRGIEEDREKADKLVAKALDHLEKAAELDPDNPRLLLQRGLQLANIGRYETAITSLEKSITRYEEFIPRSSIHPDWGRSWIDVWLPRVKELAASG